MPFKAKAAFVDPDAPAEGTEPPDQGGETAEMTAAVKRPGKPARGVVKKKVGPFTLKKEKRLKV